MATATRPDQSQQTVNLAFESHYDMPRRTELPVRGELPTWLAGQLLRNGPGRWKFDGSEVNHWFDGMSLVHSFDIADGRVHYMNRFIESRAYKQFRSSGELSLSEFASDPCRTRFQRIQSVFRPQVTDNPAINAMKFGEHHIALSETPMAYEFDPTTLETVGVAYENPDTFATAHPHLDGASGELLNLSCKFGPRSSQSFFRVQPDTLAQMRIARLKRQHPTYQHSFGMSGRWLIFTEFPFRVNPLDILRSGRPFIENFEFHPEEGTKITLIDRETGAIGGEWQAEPGFCFHHVNAWEEGEDVVVDLCRFEDVSIVENLYLEKIREAGYPEDSAAYLHRYRLKPGAERAEEHRVSEEPIELPRINYKENNCRPYSYVYGVGMGHDGGVPFDRLVKIDATWGSATIWREDNCLVGEPVFVAAPDAKAEDDGVLLSLALDGEAERSMLLVLDARDMTELARAEISRAVPPGFHGNFSRS
ncbi:MAG: carotenoid oxygenase family protein [Thermoleophilaceae bacterium]|nr:carotenoid oxygenase family protein [Thermoleophilaceae bacterium]